MEARLLAGDRLAGPARRAALPQGQSERSSAAGLWSNAALTTQLCTDRALQGHTRVRMVVRALLRSCGSARSRAFTTFSSFHSCKVCKIGAVRGKGHVGDADVSAAR